MSDDTKRMNLVNDVKDFMRLMGQQIPDKPCIPDDATVRLRLKLICEEWNELLDACMSMRDAGDDAYSIEHYALDVEITDVADALTDIMYVVVGTFVAFGIDPGPIWAEVHRSNMTKFGGGFDANGKALKGPNYKHPNIRGLLTAQLSK